MLYMRPAIRVLPAILMAIMLPWGDLAATVREPIADWAASARQAAGFLGRMQKADGLFHYQYDFIPARFSRDDHIVRQAGAAYGLGEYLLYSRDPDTARVMRQALNALKDISVTVGDGRMVSPGGRASRARTGATALALLAEMQYHQATGDDRFSRLRRDWLRALLAMHKPGGGFRRKPGSREESPYYNGEAWLALASHALWYADEPRLSDVLAQVDDALIRRYRDDPDTAFFHWGAMAAAQRYRGSGEARFARFAVQQADAYIHELRPRIKPDSNTCYAVEGLLEAQEVMAAGAADAKLRRELRQRVRAEMVKNRAFQIKPWQDRIHFGPRRYLQLGDLSFFEGAFLNGRYRPATRIDFTQHCLSATVKYLRYLESSRSD